MDSHFEMILELPWLTFIVYVKSKVQVLILVPQFELDFRGLLG